MTLLALAYLGGILTILSPCILPILPFTFARADQPFRKNGLPLLLSMALTFAGIATLAVAGGSWLVRANQYGRFVAIAVFALLGVSLLFPSLAEVISRPLVRLGSRLSQTADSGPQHPVLQSLLLGVATGFLWAPCAGPILGLILAGAAVSGPSAHTSFLLLAYAAGAVTSLTVVLLAGARVFAALKRSLGAEEWVRRILGAAVLLGAVAVAFGLDRGILTRFSLASTSGLEQKLVDRVHPATIPHISETASSKEEVLGYLTGATAWINSPPLNAEQLKGKVVLVDFWTYSCINCLRTLPYVEAWAEKYKQNGLVVIGVHTPEFPFEKDKANVEKAVHDLGVTYPVAMDNNYWIWNGFMNEYWPAHYFIDINGNIRFYHFGEGGYDQSEKWIQQLLKERDGAQPLPSGTVTVHAEGAEAAPGTEQEESPETYIGHRQSENFASPSGLKHDTAYTYAAPEHLKVNQWAFAGKWVDHEQIAASLVPHAKIVYRFHARDLHLVLGPGADGKPIHFHVTLDGQPLGENHGADTDVHGEGVVTEYRLYQLIRLKEGAGDHVFEIDFDEPGVQAFAFTFG